MHMPTGLMTDTLEREAAAAWFADAMESGHGDPVADALEVAAYLERAGDPYGAAWWRQAAAEVVCPHPELTASAGN